MRFSVRLHIAPVHQNSAPPIEQGPRLVDPFALGLLLRQPGGAKGRQFLWNLPDSLAFLLRTKMTRR